MAAHLRAKARGIPFSAPMVRALLETPPRKSQTRRLVRKPERLEGLMLAGEEGEWCPYGRPGDLLWVRETWYCDDYRVQEGPYLEVDGARDLLYYRATDCDPNGQCYTGFSCETMDCPWRPSIHMPKWAARIWLEIVEVRCQRLQEISEEDARAEGVEPFILGHGPVSRMSTTYPGAYRSPTMYRDGFEFTWSEMHDKPAEFGKSWRANPWVWAISFKPADPEQAAHLRERLKERRAKR